MAKDDYEVLKYKILVYLYGIFKMKYPYQNITFKHYLNHEIDGYIVNVLKLMHSEGLIDGFCYMKSWGGDIIMLSEFRNLEITAKGIEYLKDSSKTTKVVDFIKNNYESIGNLAIQLGLIATGKI